MTVCACSVRGSPIRAGCNVLYKLITCVITDLIPGKHEHVRGAIVMGWALASMPEAREAGLGVTHSLAEGLQGLDLQSCEGF